MARLAESVPESEFRDHGDHRGMTNMSPATSLNRVQRDYALGPYGQIHYRRSGPAGARSPLLLLHPCPSSSYVFEDFMIEMGRDRSVIAPDLPGFGMSDL